MEESPVMRDYIYFFILFTLLEIFFTAMYYLLVKSFDIRMLIGAVIYAFGMASAYLAYRKELYQKKRRELIDALQINSQDH